MVGQVSFFLRRRLEFFGLCVSPVSEFLALGEGRRWSLGVAHGLKLSPFAWESSSEAAFDVGAAVGSLLGRLLRLRRSALPAPVHACSFPRGSQVHATRPPWPARRGHNASPVARRPSQRERLAQAGREMGRRERPVAAGAIRRQRRRDREGHAASARCRRPVSY